MCSKAIGLLVVVLGTIIQRVIIYASISKGGGEIQYSNAHH